MIYKSYVTNVYIKFTNNVNYKTPLKHFGGKNAIENRILK
jgi:hypothetical protein